MLDMLVQMAKAMGLSDVKVQLNTLGGPEARELYRGKLREFFLPKQASLSEHARQRLTDNPLRILDSKDPTDQAACEGAPRLLECLTDEDKQHWEGLLAALERLRTPYEIDPRLVRGLDYYTRTCFEIVASSGEIGSQSAILGGGRYDQMLESLGGPSVPAIGFAMGLERILLTLGDQDAEEPTLCFIAPLGPEAQLEALTLAQGLRAAGVRVELDSRGNSMKSMLRRANNMGARLALVLGKDEIAQGIVQVKDLAEHTQTSVPRADVVSAVQNLSPVSATQEPSA
jgi:histidyl-tRNA synthetase